MLVETTGRGIQEYSQSIWQATAAYTSHFDTTGLTKFYNSSNQAIAAFAVGQLYQKMSS